MTYHKTHLGYLILFALSFCIGLNAFGKSHTPHHPDILFAEVGGQSLRLDLYFPEDQDTAPPLVVFIHGGSWTGGHRFPCPLAWLSDHGYAVASISYRFSQDAPFPAQIHDCKGAIRWLCAHADDYGYDPERIAVAGVSAGGMLAALVGTSGGIDALEGTTAGHLEQSSRVDAVISYFGATDFLLRARNQPKKTERPGGVVYQLLGGAVGDNPVLARSASAAFHVDPSDPPLLLFHGSLDKTVLPVQSERIADAYREAGLPVQHVVLEGAGHGDDIFFQNENAHDLLDFLNAYLLTSSPTPEGSRPVLRLHPPDLTSSESSENGGSVGIRRRNRENEYELKIVPPSVGANNTYARLTNQKSIQKGHYYELTYSMRVAARTGNTVGQGGIRLTLGALPPSGEDFERNVIERQSVAVVGSDWETFRYSWQAIRDYAPGEFRIEFRPNYFREIIVIQDIKIEDFGTESPPQGRQGEAYSGHAANAPWRDAAKNRIQRYRMNDLDLEVTDEWGRPIEDATIQISMRRHAYLFGTCVQAKRLVDTENTLDQEDLDRAQFQEDNTIYRNKLQELFNFVVFENDMKWPNWAGLRADQGFSQAATMAAVDWLTQHDFTIKSHTMLWPSWDRSPAFLRTQERNPDALRDAIERHLIDQSVAFKSRVAYADIVNEALSHNDLIEAVGEDIVDDWFRIVRMEMPGTKLVINEFDILGNGGSKKRQDRHYDLIKRLLANDAPIDVLGFQSHFWSTRLTPPDRLYAIIDRFASFGLPLMVSEFDMNLLDEELQADYTRDFLTLWFSHPQTEAFIMWGFWAKAHWFGEPGAMFRADWSPKPNLAAYTDLVFGDWWTEETLSTDAKGRTRLRVFKGDYEITVSAPGYHTATRRLRIESEHNQLVVLYPESD